VERFLLRLPAELKTRLENDAKASGESLNSLIMKRLSESPDDLVLTDGTGEKIARLKPEQTSLIADSVTERAASGPIPLRPGSSGKRSYEPDPKTRKKP
jgi:hypothetical protein